MNKEFEPKILAFLCNWCSYAAADLAGGAPYPVSPNNTYYQGYVFWKGGSFVYHIWIKEWF
jgi:hypothetical protein